MIFIDSEGSPIQEFSALYVDPTSQEIKDVYHRYIAFPSDDGGGDSDWWARRHVHGLNRAYLTLNGLADEQALLCDFNKWLQSHPYDKLLAHAPDKERAALHLPVQDVCLPSWQERGHLLSHRIALSMKRKCISICGVSCSLDAHSSYVEWRPRRRFTLAPSDVHKRHFGHHCSLFDCIECYLFMKN